MKDFENYGLLYLSGFFSLLIGVLIVVSHNVWSADWRVIITLLGWMSLIKGVTRFFWPELTIKMIEKTKDASWFSPVMVVFLVVGVYLMYVGFGS